MEFRVGDSVKLKTSHANYRIPEFSGIGILIDTWTTSSGIPGWCIKFEKITTNFYQESLEWISSSDPGIFEEENRV